MLYIAKSDSDNTIVVDTRRSKLIIDSRDMIHIVHGNHYGCNVLASEIFERHYKLIKPYKESKK